MLQHQPTLRRGSGFYSSSEAAAILWLHEKSMMRWVREGTLTARKIDGYYKFDVSYINDLHDRLWRPAARPRVSLAELSAADADGPIKQDDAAALLHASTTSVRSWIDQGFLSVMQTPGGNKVLWRREIAALGRKIEREGEQLLDA
jgi:hypothetical protein